MNNKNLLSGRDKELQQLAEQYEAAREAKKPLYLDADDLADLADWYSVKRKYNKAIEVADYGLELHPNNTPLLIEKAYIYIDCDQSDKARTIVENLDDIYSSESKIIRAHFMLEDGEIGEAEDLLESIEDKEELSSLIDVAYMYLEVGFPDKAIEWLNTGSEKHGDSEAYLAVMADSKFAENSFTEAEKLYNRLIDINPYSAPYWVGLAKCYYELKKTDKAIEACDYALISDDEFTDAYILKGHCFQQLGNDEKALENYEKAKELHGVSPDFTYTFRAYSKLGHGEWQEALDNFEKAIEYNEEIEDYVILPELYINAALCLAKLKKKRKSHQYCKKAMDLDPDMAELYVIEGRIYFEEDNSKKAFESWNKALKISQHADTWHEIGLHSFEMGAWEYARYALEKVSEMEPNYEGVNERLALLFMILRDKENFVKYNSRSQNPFEMEDFEAVLAELSNTDQKDLALYMQKVIKALK